ncbi:hypothetical protein Tco_0209984 [Tanacetum coccineum]
MVLQLTDFTSEITDEELREFTSEYYIPFALHPVVPAASASIADFPEGKVGVYTRFFEFANQRVPLSLFMCNVLNYYRLHISQLHCIGAAKITNFEVNCRLLAINPTVHLFRAFYHTSWSNGWVSFSKRAGRLQCYTEKLDALRRWREMFFWVDDALVPWDFAFYTQGSLPRDERPPPGSYSMEDAELINENRRQWNSSMEASGGCEYDGLAPTLPLRSVPKVQLGLPQPPPILGDDGAGPSKRVRHVSLGLSTSTEEETPDASPTLAAKEVTETPPPNDSSAWLTACGTVTTIDWPKAFEGMPVDQLMEEFDMVTAQQAALVAQLRARWQVTAESSGSDAQNLAEEKMALLVKVEKERADAAEYKASCHWAVKYLEGWEWIAKKRTKKKANTTNELGWKRL